MAKTNMIEREKRRAVAEAGRPFARLDAIERSDYDMRLELHIGIDDAEVAVIGLVKPAVDGHRDGSPVVTVVELGVIRDDGPGTAFVDQASHDHPVPDPADHLVGAVENVREDRKPLARAHRDRDVGWAALDVSVARLEFDAPLHNFCRPDLGATDHDEGGPTSPEWSRSVGR